MIKSKFLKRQMGFTLMEIIVVLAVFSILILLLINVFLLSLRAQRQASNRQDAVANLRFVLETMAQNIRTSEIDYSQPLNPQVLDLQSGSNKISFSLTGREMVMTVNGQASTLTNAKQVEVLKLNFLVDPPNNPFAEERCSSDSDCSAASVSAGGCTAPSGSSSQFKSGYCRCSSDSACQVVGRCASNPDIAGQNLCLPFDRQPRVTASLGFQTVGGRPQDVKTVFLQTTVSSRIYKR